jgi:hypothetical protein
MWASTCLNFFWIFKSFLLNGVGFHGRQEIRMAFWCVGLEIEDDIHG